MTNLSGFGQMFRDFLRSKRGNFASMTALAAVPILGGLAMAVDYTELARQRAETLNALDAAGIATARRIAEGASDDDAKIYAQDFFEANLRVVDPKDATLTVVLPNSNFGGGTLKMSADLVYRPYFFPGFQKLIGTQGDDLTAQIDFSADTEIRLKNTLEVALVLDNSGSMDFNGSGSGTKRIDLLKAAAKELVTTLSKQAAHMKQISKPVQFGLVPFASAVNVGPQHATASWMDLEGRSTIHHENFNWASLTASNKKVSLVGGVYRKVGSGWGAEENQIVTRFSLFNELKRQDGTEKVQTGTKETCSGSGSRRVCTTEPVYTDVPVYKPFAKWEGCVEMRPSPYTFTNEVPTSSKSDSYYVPMFAPDETDTTDSSSRPANNNWWKDDTTSTATAATRQANMTKYFVPAANGTAAMGLDEGPNASCTTKPITPLEDVTTEVGLNKIRTAIDAMTSLGGTNVPQGIVWGWNVVSGSEPFTEARGDTERGNDKVVIVLTDGANTYYTPTSVTAYKYSGTYWNYGGNDSASNRSLYSAYGYTGKAYAGGHTRLFRDTSSAVGKTTYSNANYGTALNEHMLKICENAKNSNIMVMTVALDLSSTVDAEKKQIEALKSCASYSRFRKDETDPTKPAKLFYNATGKTLADKFKEIADELSNLRIVG
jgi:Flp pilus assembly protein TadG